jgi:hypothetical protein
MAQAVLFGTDASISSLYGGALFNAFTVSVTQGITQAAGFGDSWIRTRGTIMSATISMSGFVTKGTAGDRPGVANGTTLTLTRTGGTVTATFYSGCTMAFVGIPTGVGLDVQFLGNQTVSYGYASDGPVTETWVTS